MSSPYELWLEDRIGQSEVCPSACKDVEDLFSLEYDDEMSRAIWTPNEPLPGIFTI